jgi:peptidoglycan/LPS O-acetylase OafA/YrhL
MKLLGKHPQNRILELDGVRAIAILLVLGFHYINSLILVSNTGSSQFVKVLAKITSLGWSGVDLFQSFSISNSNFVLPAYLQFISFDHFIAVFIVI